MSALRPGDITDEMIQAMDTAKRQGLQKDLRTLAANIRSDAEGRYDSAASGGRPVSSGRCCGSKTPPAS
ncbi:hypothetical protein [Streptomyces sp. enrichment culture]|uniref:hypothetical protein n=1 Tax=Streptomyces sp. enrichment culture TaxID=1795815 RepID=UPI003F565945